MLLLNIVNIVNIPQILYFYDFYQLTLIYSNCFSYLFCHKLMYYKKILPKTLKNYHQDYHSKKISIISTPVGYLPIKQISPNLFEYINISQNFSNDLE